jgi:PTS system N-acetylglucosamine-specific IIA component
MVVSAPLSGLAVPLHKVPDPVFAKAIVGPGVAITPDPREQLVLAPISGRLVKLKPHAFVIAGADDRAVLVHLGIDTVQLNGVDSELIATEGQEVIAGEPVARWHPERVIAAGLSPLCPVIALDASPEVISMVAEGPVEAGADLFTWS